MNRGDIIKSVWTARCTFIKPCGFVRDENGRTVIEREEEIYDDKCKISCKSGIFKDNSIMEEKYGIGEIRSTATLYIDRDAPCEEKGIIYRVEQGGKVRYYERAGEAKYYTYHKEIPVVSVKK